MPDFTQSMSDPVHLIPAGFVHLGGSDGPLSVTLLHAELYVFKASYRHRGQVLNCKHGNSKYSATKGMHSTITDA